MVAGRQRRFDQLIGKRLGLTASVANTSFSTTIATMNINVDRLQSVGGNRRDIEGLIRLLKPELDRLIARTR